LSLLHDYIHTLSVCRKRLDAYHVTLQFFIKLGAARVAVCIPDPAVEGQLVVRLSHGMKEASNKILRGSGVGSVAALEAYRQKRLIRVDDYAAREQWIRTDLERLAGVEAALYVPVAGHGSSTGVIIAVPPQEAHFSEADAETAAAMGRALGDYLDKHPVAMRHSEEPLSRGETQVSLGELADAFQHCIDTADIFELSDRTMAYCLGMTQSEFGFVGYIDPANGFLTVPTMTKEIFPESKIEGKTMVFEKPGGLGGLVLDTDRSVVANDPLNHPASVGTPPGHLPIRKFMGVPCMIHGKKVGMIALANKIDDYSRTDLELVESFASLYATSVSSFFAREALEETNRKYVALYNDAPVAYFTMEADGKIVQINASGHKLLDPEKGPKNFTQWLDDASKKLLNERIEAIVMSGSAGEAVELELGIGGRLRTLLLSMTPHFDERGYLRHLHCSALDISERKAAEAQLNFLAYNDEVTGVPNRTMMRRYLEQALQRAKRQKTKVGLLFFDLDRFKTINDTLGHAVGDDLLRTLAEKLKATFREVDLLARFGGDEFVLVADNLTETQGLEIVAAKLLQLFSEPLQIGERSLYISGSIGISVFPDDALDAGEMIKNADTAMYRGKERGGNNFTFYQEHFNLAASDRLSLEGEMRGALTRREFTLCYQPQYDMRSGALIGVEALLRWRHGSRGVIPPSEFIPLAEENGFIIPLGSWVLEEAMRQLHAWHREGYAGVTMSVNVSAKQFLQGEALYTILQRLLERYPVPPGSLCVEITESTLANIEEMCRSLHALRELGITFAVDDFGTGYSSMTYLRRLPISLLKIDKSFVEDIGRNSDDEAISMAIISMAHSMGMKVLAEGVEQEEQLEFLRANGCDYYQGFYRSRPLPVEAVTALLPRGV